jgi:hypothetical protein
MQARQGAAIKRGPSNTMRRRVTFESMKRSAAAILLLLCSPLALVPQSSSLEDEVKAAFIYNFAQFIQWPNRAFPTRNSPFTMCAIGDPAEGTLEKTIEGERLNGRSITVRRLTPTDRLQGCHLVYVGALEAKRSEEVITAAKRIFASDGVPILTIGDSEDFIDLGGMIRFTQADRRIRFEINPDAAQRVSLRVSSRLLRLADIVRPRQRSEAR